MRRQRFVCLCMVLAFAVAGLSSCHITWGGRGTLNRVIDPTLDRPVVQVSELSPRGD